MGDRPARRQGRRDPGLRAGRGLAALVALVVSVAACSPTTGSDLGSLPSPDDGPRDVAPSPTPTPTSTPTPTPTPADPVRLGLHVTDLELETWRARAAAGPYRSAGDVAPNSPGDWDRIVANRDAFVADPSRIPWDGPPDESPGDCVSGGSRRSDPPDLVRVGMRDTAFHALVTGDETSAKVAADALLRQATEHADLDFADAERWCRGRVVDDRNPSFEIAGTLTSLAYTFDYLRIHDPELLTREEQTAILDWLHAAAEWLLSDVDEALRDNFTDRLERPGPPYTLTADRAADPGRRYAAYDGGPANIDALARYYNNRRAGSMRFVGVLAVLLRDVGYTPPEDRDYDVDTLYERAHRYVRDHLVYSTFDDGTVGDLHRWTEDLPDLGWAYGVQALSPLVTVADTYARAGDPSLYRYLIPTRDGGGTTDRRIVDSVRGLVAHVDGSWERYVPGSRGEPNDRIDGRHPAERPRWDSIHELGLLPAAVWAGDEDLTAAIVRRDRPWPDEPAQIGRHSAWSGDWGTLPAVLLLFADTGVDPYLAGIAFADRTDASDVTDG